MNDTNMADLSRGISLLNIDEYPTYVLGPR